MEVFGGLENYDWKKVTVTTGMFDGVHLGHKELIRYVTEQARYFGEKSVLVTYKPHPRYVINPKDKFKLLTTYNERVRYMAETGLDAMVVIPFTPETAKIKYADFVKNYLVDKIGISHYIFGYDHRFGKNRQGTYDEVVEIGKLNNFEAIRVEAVHNNEEPVSSSRIREALNMGDVLLANSMLGYNYALTGNVVKGVQIGRSIGFPTANIEPEDLHKLIPGMGVYAVRVFIGGLAMKGMLNIGIRPTVNSNAEYPTIEVHVLGFSGDLYNKTITVQFVSKIREEMKFSGLDALVDQLKRDKELVLSIL